MQEKIEKAKSELLSRDHSLSETVPRTPIFQVIKALDAMLPF